MPYSIVLFDLDGTLINSAAGVTNSVVHALSTLGIQARAEDLNHFIGPPLYDSFKKHYSLSDEQSAQAVRAYREYYSQGALFLGEPYPGVEDLLRKLTQKNYQLAVTTSKPKPSAEKVLDHFGLSQYFDYIEGPSFTDRATKSDVVARVINYYGQDQKSEMVLVGDTHFDLVGARDNGIDLIAVSYGFGDWSQEENLVLARDTHELGALLGV